MLTDKDDFGLIPLKKISPFADMYLTTNQNSPIKITGIAQCHIRESKNLNYRRGYLVLYEKYGTLNKAEISEQLYNALSLVFDAINDIDGCFMAPSELESFENNKLDCFDFERIESGKNDT